MPSRWSFLCCTCDKDDRYEYQKPYARVKGKARTKKPTDKQFTWTRKSLLKNEQSEYQETPFDQLAHQIHNEKRHKSVNYENKEIELKTFEDSKPKRRTVHEVFENTQGQGQEQTERRTNTTFPWMNEEYVPNGRSVTRLGISSVQINAKRNEQAQRNASRNITSENNVHQKVYMKSQSFNDGQYRDHTVYGKPMIRTNAAQSNVRTTPNGYQNNTRAVPNGHGFRGNVTTAPNKGNTVAVPTGAGKADRPMLLHAPNSKVGVRVVETHARNNKGVRVPKLGDYLLLKPDSKIPVNQGHHLNPRHGEHYRQLTNETNSDISFRSEITFKKSNMGSDHTDLSLKRSKQPTMFSPNANKYERLKTRGDTSLPYSINDVNGPKPNVESMYGYVPKAVQDVHASNALSGGQIDDYRINRMGDKDLEKFASIDRKEQRKDWRDIMESSYIGDRKASDRPKSVPAYINAEQNYVRPQSGVETGKEGHSDYANVRVGLQQIKLAPPPSRRDVRGNVEKLPDKRRPNFNNYVNVETYGSDIARDENENKVIMINFPPNLNKGNGNSSVQTTSRTGHSDTPGSGFTRDSEKLMVNPLKESQEVLY